LFANVVLKKQASMKLAVVLTFGVGTALLAARAPVAQRRGRLMMTTAVEEKVSKLPATVKPGVVTGKALMDLLAYAKETGFAIPAVNAVSSCGINACLEAAAKFGGPMIVQCVVSSSESHD